MTNIPFFKYTSLGNNFVLVDETKGPVLTEDKKSQFAFYATNKSYGVGSDNFLVIQKCSETVLAEIGRDRHYWIGLPDYPEADYLFRMFEPDGTEAFSCGNGLMCMACHLYTHYGITNARILTELPTGKPKLVTIGNQTSNGYCWANLGEPRPISSEIARIPTEEPFGGMMNRIDDLEIKFRKHDLAPISEEQSLRISGYLTFTGEPHMVVFPESGFSIKGLEETMFPAITSFYNGTGSGEKRLALGTWLLNHIGIYINRNYAHIFPAGISINVVNRNYLTNVLEYRCFERGINVETSACGTGALAVSCVAKQLGLTKDGRITILPIRCRWDEPDAQMLVEREKDGWSLHAQPRILVKGEFYLPQRKSLKEKDRLDTHQQGAESINNPVDERFEKMQVCAG